MAVPDTNTFSLQDVTNELGLGSGDSLIDCFNDATSSEFDPNYKGDGDRLSNFRNYGGPWVGKFILINTITPGNSTSWSNQNTTLYLCIMVMMLELFGNIQAEVHTLAIYRLVEM